MHINNEPDKEPLVKEVSREELDFMEVKTREYIEQGANALEASKMAAEDWAKQNQEMTAEQQQVWDQLTKQVGLADFIKDQIIRCLSSYKKSYHKSFPNMSIDFKMYLKNRKLEGNQAHMIGGASLFLEFCYNGVWYVWREKRVDFTHIREMRNGHAWKLALYEAMLHDILAWGVTHLINIHEIKHAPKQPANTEQ